MIERAFSRLLGSVCPACEGHYRNLERHWAVDHRQFGLLAAAGPRTASHV